MGALFGLGLFRLKLVVLPKWAPVFVNRSQAIVSKSAARRSSVYRLNNTVVPVQKFLFLVKDAQREQ